MKKGGHREQNVTNIDNVNDRERETKIVFLFRWYENNVSVFRLTSACRVFGPFNFTKIKLGIMVVRMYPLFASLRSTKLNQQNKTKRRNVCLHISKTHVDQPGSTSPHPHPPTS